MTQHLVITAIGSDRPGICNQVVQLITQSGCNIIDSRIALFGNEFTLIMLISGSANHITRVETTLPVLGQEHELITMMKRTARHQEPLHRYTLEVFIESEDRKGLTEQFTQFFANRNIGLASLSAQTISAQTYRLQDTAKGKAPATHDKDLFQITMSTSIDADYNLVQLQEEFNQLCTSLSVQGTLNFIATN